jgi:hypothetical protein
MCALGWFVHTFAGVESMLHRLLVEKSGLTPSEGAALFSGVRMKGAMDALNRLFETHGQMAEKAALARPFKQLGEISSIRDDLLHYGAQEDTAGEVSNFQRKHLEDRATTRRVSLEDVVCMTVDLRLIELHFVASMVRTAKRATRKQRALYEPQLQEPWNYTPRAPIPLPRDIG